MPSLDVTQVRLIEQDVERARLTLQTLSHELVDHICCEVERLMDSGQSFDEAYASIRAETGMEVLKKIQENTLYLIDQRFARMKNFMKISGNVAMILLAVGTVLKIGHLPLASPLLVLGFASLALLFLPTALYLNQTYSTSGSKTVVNVATLFGGIGFITGILFKLMHWPGAGMLLFVGWTILLLVLLPVLLTSAIRQAATNREKGVYVLGAVAVLIFESSAMFKVFHWPGAGMLMVVGSVLLISFFLPLYAWMKFKANRAITGEFIYLVVLSMYGIVLTALLALNVSPNVLARFAQDEAEANQITRYFEATNQQAATTGAATQEAKTLSEEATQVCNIIRNIRIDLLASTEQYPAQAETNREAQRLLLARPDAQEPVALLMLHPGDRSTQLKNALDNYRVHVMAAIATDPRLTNSISQLLATGAESDNWPESQFRNNMVISTLAYLRDCETKVRMVELEVLRFTAQQAS